MSGPGLSLQYQPTGQNGTVRISAIMNGQAIHADKLDISRSTARERFKKAILGRHPGIDQQGLEAELLRIASELNPQPAAQSQATEVEVAGIVRPELFHTREVSGMLVPRVTIAGNEPVARWMSYLRWADGRREQRALAPSIETSDGRRLWLHPLPAEPEITARPLWTAEARSQWLQGRPAPHPRTLFNQLCESFARFLEFSPDSGHGDRAVLSLWTVLTYVYPVWNAVPYLNIGGPLGSGKSRVFELLARLAFRPLVAANMTAPTLFRTLHEQGGILLLDEAERLRDGTPDAAEIRSILLSGYKAGTPAKRLEAVGNKQFKTATFDVFGPKAIAGISALPEALSSRCIRMTMFRCGPESEKPRRRVDEQPRIWAQLRDDLHALALEHGPTWHDLATRAGACPAMMGRDFELWQPLLALADWIEEAGEDHLLGTIQEHAERIIEISREDATPDTDEVLLRLLTEAVLAGSNAALTPSELLRQASAREQSQFSKWSTRGVANALKRYGIVTTRWNGQRTYSDVSPAMLVRIERAYGLDLGLSPKTRTLCTHSTDPFSDGQEPCA